MDKKLNIYTIADSFLPNIGGMEKVAENSAIELGKEHNSIIFAPKIGGYTDTLPVKVVRVKSIPIKKPQYMIVLPKLDFKMKKYIKANPPDIIHLHNLAPLCKWFAKYGKKHNIPTFLTIHGYVENDINCATKSKFLGKILKKYFFKTIDLVPNLITVSNGCKKYYEEAGYDNIQIIRNSIDELNKDEEYCELIKKTYNLNKTDNILCFVNRLIEIKNVFLMLESFKILKTKNFEFKALIAGDGNCKEDLEILTKKYNLENNVFFLGNILERNKVASIYALGDIHIFPSINDTFGLSIGESASQNVPTLGMKYCSSSEQIMDNENGFLSENDALSYANKIIEIFKDKENIKLVGRIANETLYNTWNKYKNNILKEYKKAIK